MERSRPPSGRARAVNVIIPVYRGVDETARCLASVISSGVGSGVFVTVINDASPEPAMGSMLDRYAAHSGVAVLRNSSNLGFVATVNRGILHRPDADVVLLNSDTEVPVGWLERLQRSVYAATNIGTATPFSNNATICSYPRFCTDNALPDGYSVNSLDELFKTFNAREAIDLPTGVGFCMYIRRDCLDEVGMLDEERFGRGYGEENDFCLRAARKGWRNVLCADLFVFHAGAVSFAWERDGRAKHALELLAEDHPGYEALIQRHVSRDPAKHLRHRIDLLRLANSAKNVVLLISHRLGGGVVRHEKELSRLLAETTNFLRLTPGSYGQIEVAWYSDTERLRLHFRLPTDWQELVALLKRVGVTRIHIHHLMEVPKQVEELPKTLGVPFDFTAHDYFSFCPRITLTSSRDRYCGEPPEEGCRACLKNAPADQRNVRAWRARYRELLVGAQRVLAPSQDTARRMRARFQLTNLIVLPHSDLRGKDIPAPAPGMLACGERLRIVVIGALGPNKGADLLEAVALDAKKKGLPLQFHLIGYAWRTLVTEPRSLLTVSGRYEDDALPGLLADARPHLVWFPALWPETYSYTLSAAILSGAPIVAPDLGAFSERLAGRPWTWICPWDTPPADWSRFFVNLREAHFLTGTPPALFGSRPAQVDDSSHMPPSEGEEARSVLSDPYGLVRFADSYTAPNLPLMRRLSLNSRAAVLQMGLTLRSMPVFRAVVRRIPISWQYRVRHWLVR